MKNGNGSFWLDSTREQARVRPRLEGDIHADAVVVGGGYTGLWTAYWLKRADPSLSVVVLEQEYVGFGASGRNGGWISGKTVGVRRNLSSGAVGREDVLAIERACHEAVFEIDDLMRGEGKEIDAQRGGWMQIARTESELERLKRHLAEDRDWGLTESEVRLMDAEETFGRVRAPGVRGGIFSPYAVKCNPAKLVYALAELCEELGVVIFENTRVESFADGDCRTTRGHARANTVVLATEAYTSRLPGRRREILPMLSSMVVTEPLEEAAWEEIGWSGHECMSGAQHMYFYSQRTADGRIALGGRGVPYFWNSDLDRNGELDRGTIAQLTETVQSLFPAVPMTFAHAWRGVLGVPRDWSPFVHLDRTRRLVRVGGYAGQGVTAAYVAGRIVADLLSCRPSELSRSAWVRALPRKWEPEPLRWVGSRAVQSLYHVADSVERRRGGPRTSVFGTAGDLISGR
ncbi:NAD(P)/FAD-dependent oxidoreductase [Brevibacterium album]|uniref:NAD(P)/FAD-dependent oxidoreductase n=1 Tax=Brevibacterium album TaxID=417948 RepID=UPI000414D40C|nr:FAD-dependent oxidoreductase [Brevibacterium album]